MGILTTLAAKLTLDTKGYRTGLQDAEKKTGLFSKGIGKLGPQIAAAFSIGVIVKFGSALADLNKDIENSTRAFERFGNAALLSNLRAATGGMISDLKLMQQAIQAVNLNLNPTDLPAFFKFATIRAAETGMEVDHLVESIVTGIGRESRLVLDNLGISLIALNKEIAKGGTFAEAATRIITRVANESNTSIKQATKGTKELNGAWNNLIQEVAKGELGAEFDDAARSLARLIKLITDNKQKIHDSLSFMFRVEIFIYKSFKEDLDKILNYLEGKPFSKMDLGFPLFDDFIGPPQFGDLKDMSSVLRTVDFLNAEIKDLNSVIGRSFDNENIKLYQDEIIKLQEELDKLLNNVSEPFFDDTAIITPLQNYSNRLLEIADDYYSKLEAMRNKQKEAMLESFDIPEEGYVDDSAFGGIIPEASSYNDLISKATMYQDILDGITESNPAWEYFVELLKNINLELDKLNNIEKPEKIESNLNALVTAAARVASAFAGMGDAITNIIIGEDILGAVAQFLGELASLMVQFAALLVAFGTGQALMESGNPYAMIAGGIAMAAALISIASTISKIGKVNSSGSSAGGGSYSSGSAGGDEYDFNREIVMVARGDDLVAVLNNTNDRNSYNF